ncbi:MAG: cytochrome-c peroxidase [Blastocatellia bacterium]
MENKFAVTGWMKRVIFILLAVLALVGLGGWESNAQRQQVNKLNPLQVRLGERLFREERFTTAKGDLATSCAICHLTDQDPQGRRVFTDFFNRSWVPFRPEDPRRTEIRNSPTLLDVALMPRLHLDGEFKSLEELVAGTFSGRPMGWLPGEEEQAFNQVQVVLLADKPTEASVSYREQFKAAFDVELEKLSRDQIIGLVSKAVADFMRTMRSKLDSPYDRFVKLNGLAAAAAEGESSKEFAARTLAKLAELESKKTLKLGNGFNQTALAGFRIFLRTEGATSVGNCVACHAPPLFTDNSFHNLGVSQVEFDRLNGAGKFAQFEIPDAATAKRPSSKFRETVEKGRLGVADLGHWNFVDMKASPLRRTGESDDQLLRRMIGAFKTPTLRHLAYTEPYFHSGDYSSLEDVLREIIRLSEMARAGQLREPDEELKQVKLKESDVSLLIAFLTALNE